MKKYFATGLFTMNDGVIDPDLHGLISSNPSDHEVCRASEVDARIAELEAALRQAIEWNWMQDDVPMGVIEQVAAALGVPALEL